jgi:hypothetical protein
MRSADWRDRVRKIIEQFSAAISGFYSSEHSAAGQIVATDRHGEQRAFSLLTLSVAALDSDTVGADSADAIAHLLAHVKRMAKAQSGNSFVFRTGERLVDLMVPHRPPMGDDPQPFEQLVG